MRTPPSFDEGYEETRQAQRPVNTVSEPHELSTTRTGHNQAVDTATLANFTVFGASDQNRPALNLRDTVRSFYECQEAIARLVADFSQDRFDVGERGSGHRNTPRSCNS